MLNLVSFDQCVIFLHSRGAFCYLDLTLSRSAYALQKGLSEFLANKLIKKMMDSLFVCEGVSHLVCSIVAH